MRAEIGISVGYVRAVAPNYTFFAVETLMDELANLPKVDPVKYRLDLLGGRATARQRADIVADPVGWGTPLPANVGRGIACAIRAGEEDADVAATVIQARVDPATGNVKVEKIICAVDCGIVVQPDGVRSQVEGSLLFGLSSALIEKQGTVAKGALEQRTSTTYQVLRMSDVPDVKVEVHVVRARSISTGVGEPGATTIAPALSNAIFAATGARVRQVPLQPDRVLRRSCAIAAEGLTPSRRGPGSRPRPCRGILSAHAGCARGSHPPPWWTTRPTCARLADIFSARRAGGWSAWSDGAEAAVGVWPRAARAVVCSLDLAMPRAGGLEALAEIRAADPGGRRHHPSPRSSRFPGRWRPCRLRGLRLPDQAASSRTELVLTVQRALERRRLRRAGGRRLERESGPVGSLRALTHMGPSAA